MYRSILGVLILSVFLGQSCATPKKESKTRPSSKVVYSLMMKDGIGLESLFSEDLKKSLKGEMLLKAVSSMEKRRGDMEAIEFIQSKNSVDHYAIKMKEGKAPLKLLFNKQNKLENVWVDDVALKSAR